MKQDKVVVTRELALDEIRQRGGSFEHCKPIARQDQLSGARDTREKTWTEIKECNYCIFVCDVTYDMYLILYIRFYKKIQTEVVVLLMNPP